MRNPNLKDALSVDDENEEATGNDNDAQNTQGGAPSAAASREGMRVDMTRTATSQGGRGKSGRPQTAGRGGGGRGAPGESAMTAIQKRRKEQSKARKGNHNRKAGAARKMAGMVPRDG